MCVGGAAIKLQYGADPIQLLLAPWMIIILFTKRSSSASLYILINCNYVLLNLQKRRLINQFEWIFNSLQICQQKWVSSLPPGAMPRTESLQDLVTAHFEKFR